MLNYIENLLYEKTKNSQSQILYAQWNYDKKVIPDVLRSISNLFPHYSLHDESHSITIINNIVRILGKENLEKLSAIDLWLILEASYSHDIGMAVSAKEIRDTLDSKDFITFFRHILRDEKNSLYEFASQFEIIKNKIEYKSKHLNLELHDGIKFILAEFYRSSHSNRSKDIISGENQVFELSHFGAIIPKRIFKILGSICDSHTQNFEEVMKLSFSEVGIDTEDAHPRFIACMLRIGDLLDLDNHRFSDVMLRTLHKIPLETLNHKDKHLSIESFRVDRKIIEITARCENYEVANITQHWFNYLHSEITNQMIKWNKIVPSKEFGYLPTIGNLRVELKKYDFIDGKEKPQFKVDTEKALALLQGAGIYEDAYQSIREILQNAVDATLIRIWLEHRGDKNKDKIFEKPTSEYFLSLLENYPITINITENRIEDEKKIWKIEIEDCGIGISKNDLKFLMNTGSSSKNRKKRDIIDNMPIWMKPSGTFGIGFQSIFMLTEQVTIESKSFFDEQFQIIELNSPNSKRNGAILVEKKDCDHSQKVGSKIIFEYKASKIPTSYTLGKEDTLAKKIVNTFDPIIDDSFDIEIAHIVDKISIFNAKNYLPIKLFFQNNLLMDIKKKSFKKFQYYSKNNALEIYVYKDRNIEGSWLPQVYYKGQHVEKNNLWSINFFPFDINILGDDASKVLTIDRNKIRVEYKEVLNKRIFDTLYEYVTTDYDNLTKKKKHKIVIDTFLTFYFLDKVNENSKDYDSWKDNELQLNNTFKKLGNLLQNINKIIFTSKQVNYDDRLKKDEYIFNKKTLEVIIYNNNNITEFIKIITPKYFNSIILKESKNQIIATKIEYRNPIKYKEIKNFLLKHKNFSYRTRVKIPCHKKYQKLKVANNANISWLSNIHSTSINLPIPSMLSPYFLIEKDKTRKLEYRVDDKLIDWVYENRYDKTTTKEEIKATYEQFREDINIDEINNEPNN